MTDTPAMRALEQGATLLTANNRLARYLKQAWDQRRIDAGDRVWETARVMPLETFLSEAYADLQASGESVPSMLSRQAARGLWEKILAEDPSRPLLNVPGTAAAVQRAWEIAHAWRYAFDDYAGPMSADQSGFLVWAGEYLKSCDELNATDPARLADLLASESLCGRVVWPQRVFLAGFHELTPQQQSLLECLQARGVEVEVDQPTRAVTSDCRRLCPPDDPEETRMAAYWARSQLEQRNAARVAIVVPDLAERRPALEQALAEAFFPGLSPAEIEDRPTIWNISLGQALTQLPMAQTALLLLRLRLGQLPARDVTRLLLSRYCAGGESEVDYRAGLDADRELRKLPDIGLDDLLKVAVDSKRAFALQKALKAMQTVTLTDSALPSQWTALFAKVLESAGWPGEQSLDSDEFQQAESIRQVLAGLTHLDAVRGNITAAAALALFTEHLTTTVYQPQSDSDAPVQVVGMLEVTGLRFDAVLVCRMDNDNWPQGGQPSAFLPLTWQQQVNAPHASAARELDYADYLLHGAMNAAPIVWFSHPQVRDENSLSPAHALQTLALDDASQWLPDVVRSAAVVLDSVEDNTGPAVIEGERVYGGSLLLESQASCPFRAFVTFRLGADEMEYTELGVDMRERGNLLHKLLEDFWREKQTQAALLALDDDALLDEITTRATALVADTQLIPGIARIERERLINTAMQWLQMEKTRTPFRVAAVEEMREITLNGIDIRLFVDRIDVVEDADGASRVIIDYKSGAKNSAAVWLDDRPEAPQLPLYAITDEHGVAAIAYGQVVPKKPGFEGFSDGEGLLPGVGTPVLKQGSSKTPMAWSEALDHWQSSLSTLADEIRSGEARVQPKKQACLYCPLKSVCRVADVSDDEEATA